MSYSYEDQYGTKLSIGRVLDVDCVNVYLRDKTFTGASISLDTGQRQAAARALAGDGYHVVRASPVDDKFIAVERTGYERLKQAASIPDWERELLAGSAAQEEIDQLKRDHDELKKRLHEAEVQSAQPDRPEPVDPASVKVGDIVDYETTVEYRLCRIVGEVEQTSEHVTGEDGISLKIHDKWWNCNIATVRILQRPEPEPDEAAVEALTDIVHDVNNSFESTPLTKSATNRFVRELARRGVEVRADG